MSFSKRKAFVISLIVLVLLGAFYVLSDLYKSKAIVTLTTKDGKEHHFFVDLAVTPAQKSKGLMGRTKLADNAGMLFVFTPATVKNFWMKDTLIPLDIIFFDDLQHVVLINKNRQPHDTTPKGAYVPVLYVLEVKGGTSDRIGLKIGDKMDVSMNARVAPQEQYGW